MNKKIISSIATALTVAMVAGTAVMAANSPTTTTATTQETVAVVEDAKVAATKAQTVTASTPAKAVAAGDVRVTADFSQVEDKTVAATVYANTKDSFQTAITEFTSTLNAKKVFAPVKFRLYKAGKSIWDNFGTFKAFVGVGNKYNGQTVSVYFIGKDGKITKTTAVVVNGKVPVELTEMGTVQVVVE